MSTFDGFIREINWISVDRFEEENSRNSTTFFLSHCHADHMRGLKNFKGRSNHYLYCSEITAVILRNINFLHLLDNIRILKLCCPTIVSIPQLDDEGYPQDVMVTLLPAGHCPGSTMIFFETAHENILYTGDFRICDKDIVKFKHLHHRNGTVKNINCIYIDTTFWKLPCEHFPSREESILLIVKEIEKWLIKRSEGHIHIDKPARIGSEFLAVALSKKFKSKIHVRQKTMELYRDITEVEDVVTLDNSSKLHMCEDFNPSKYGRRLTCQSPYVPVLYIRPTAMWYARGDTFLPFKFDEKHSFLQISLSMHASRMELASILQYLQPQKVFACVVPEHTTLEELNDELLAVARGLMSAPDMLRGHQLLSYASPAHPSNTDNCDDAADVDLKT